MLDAGIPYAFIRGFVFSFVDRRYCFQLQNVYGSYRLFIQTLPRGCIMTFLLVLFNVNNFNESLSNDAVIVLFEDDVSILTTDCKKEDAVTAAQIKVTKVFA